MKLSMYYVAFGIINTFKLALNFSFLISSRKLIWPILTQQKRNERKLGWKNPQIISKFKEK